MTTIQQEQIDIADLIDDGVRPVDVMMHREFTETQRTHANKVHQNEVVSAQQLEKLHQGQHVVIQGKPENAAW